MCWVFGYGSLIWKADFPYEKTLVGYVKGYVRRFYQKSTDHRGVPDRPGRVVTLLPSDNPDDQVWGVAYKIPSEDIRNVISHLDYREKGGYERRSVLFHPCNSLSFASSSSAAPSTLLTPTDAPPFRITIYIGTEDNPNYAGAEDIATIAGHIFVSHGPSGSNVEYLYKLASAMRAIAPGRADDHLFALEAAVRQLEDRAAACKTAEPR